MTSTNDGKNVKSYQTSGPKGKSHYIELYKSLEARLSEVSEPSVRTQHLCEAWRQVHTLCLHSAVSTHPHLLSWLQRHTARTILQTKWQSAERKDDRAILEDAINDLIAQCQNAASERDSHPWETQLIARGEWFKKILERPWDHPVLSVLLNPSGTPPTDEEVLSWLSSERGVTFVMRLQTLVAEKCEDIAASLAAALMDRVRATLVVVPDQLQTEDNKDKSKSSPSLSDFGEKLSNEAGFTPEVWELLIDIEFVLLHKRDSSRCIALAKQTPLKNAYQLVERLQSRLELAPREKRLWKNAKDVAVLIAQVVIARCMVIPVCGGVGRNALYCCSRSLSRALGARLAPAAAALAAPAASAKHLHTLATAVDAHFTQNNDQKMKPFVCELYVRAITAGMNELERLKIKTEKEGEARQMEATLCSWFVQLGGVLSASDRVRCECLLTAFSVHPSHSMYDRIKGAPLLPNCHLESEPKEEPTSEFGSWASDSRSQTNFVKTSETLNMKQMEKNQANVLSTAILNEGEALGLSPDLCHDIAVLLSGPRVKTFSWDMDREQLLEKCRVYMERTHGGTRALTTELKYLNLDPNQFMHLPEEEDDEDDMYYGIEKGYEHLVQFQDPEDIWQDPEQTESTHSHYSDSDLNIVPSRRKKKGKKAVLSSDDDADPLSIVAENQRTEKKQRPHSKERSKERKKKELTDPLDLNPSKEKKEKPPKKEKEKKERKKKVKSSRESLAKLIGIKVLKQPKPKKAATNTAGLTSSITDSDYDSQGKSPFTSINSEHNDVLYDGIFPMDNHSTPERQRKHSDNISLNNNGEIGINYTNNRFQNNQPVLDAHRKPVDYLSHSPNTVTDEVKKSLCKLIDDRRQQAMAQGYQSPMPSQKPLDSSIDDFMKCKSLITKNIETPPRKIQNAISRPKTPLQTYISPKAVVIPEIPKSIINKEQSQRLDQIKKGVEDYLQKQKMLNENSIPSPVIQYAKKNNETPLQYTNPFKMSDLVTVPQERYGPYDTKPVSTQTRPGVCRPPIRETPGQLSYQKFLEECLRSEEERSKNPPKKEIKPVSRVPPVIPNVNKAETITPKRAKPIPQQKKPDNSLNTFSRLSYMHKNKQTDIKNKSIEPTDHGNVSKGTLENKIGEFVLEHLRKNSQNQSYSTEPPKILNDHLRKTETPGDIPKYPTLSNILSHPQNRNTNINIASTTENMKPILKLNAPTPNSYLSEKDQNDLIILLRQQNRFNTPASSSRPLNLKTNSLPPPITSETHHPAPSTSAASMTNTVKKSVNENKQINILSTSIIKPANSIPNTPNMTKPNFAKKNIKDGHEKSKKAEITEPRRILGKTEVKRSEDWQAVMNAIRAQKTPIRGPNALDVALNKSSFERAFEDSLRRNEFTETNPQIHDRLKTEKPQHIKHSISPIVATSSKTKQTKSYEQPKVSNKSAGTVNNISAAKYTDSKNMVHKKPNNIDISQKMPIEQPKKKLYVGHKNDDPFISGIANSEYDLINELMDDDLRKEIGELLADEEYPAATSNILKTTKPCEKRFNVINKPLDTNPIHQKSSVVTQSVKSAPQQKITYENKALQGPPKPVNRDYNIASKPSLKTAAPNIGVPSSSQAHVYSNTNTYASNSIMIDPNVYISPVPQSTVPNMVLIGSNIVYEEYPNVQSAVAVPNITPTPNTYVTVNNVPNMTLYQSTQYAATVINPVIIESSMTMPVVNNLCSVNIQANSVGNSVHSEYNTKNDVCSVRKSCQPTPTGVSKTESKPIYNPNDRIVMNTHIKTDINITDVNLNKTSERKVLSEVQEKQVFSQIQEKQAALEGGEHKEKPKKIDCSNTIDQERLRKKRIAIINRKIWHYSERKPIALGYSPICPVARDQIIEPSSKAIRAEIYKSENIQDQKLEVGVEVASPASQDSIDNCKENKDNPETCRRILLRSSNKLKLLNDTKPKGIVKNTIIEAPENVKEAKDKLVKIKESPTKTKRLSNRLRNKSIIKHKIEKEKPQRVKLNISKKIPHKMKSKKVIAKIAKPIENIHNCMNFLDIEAEVLGSKIPKTCQVELKTNKCDSVSNESATEDDALVQSSSLNEEIIEKASSGVDHDIIVASRSSSELADDAKTQLTKDTSDVEKTASEIEVYVPILPETEYSANEAPLLSDITSNLPDVNVKEDNTFVENPQNDAAVLEHSSKLCQNNTEPETNNRAPEKITSADPPLPIKELNVPVVKSAESLPNNETQNSCIEPVVQSVQSLVTNVDSEHKIGKIIPSGVPNIDKSVNVDNSATTEVIEDPSTKHLTRIEENRDHEPQSNPSKTHETENINNTIDDDVFICNDVIKCTDSSKSVNNKTENNINLSELPQSFKDNIKIERIPNKASDDPQMKCVRMRLPNGRVFKVTAYGDVNIHSDAIFEDPSIKSVLLNSMTSNVINKNTIYFKRIIATNVKQVTPSNRAQIIDTVNLLSDDEEEITQEFITEFGKYKIQTIDSVAHKMHQDKFKLKSTIPLQRCDHQKNKDLPVTNIIDLTRKELSRNDHSQIAELENPVASATSSIDSIIESVKATWEILKENVSFNSKINKEIKTDDRKSNEIKHVKQDDVVLIDDSSSEDELNLRKDSGDINALTNELLKDLGIEKTPIASEIDDPVKLRNKLLQDLGVEIPSKNSKEPHPTSKLTENMEKRDVSTILPEIPEIDLTEDSSVPEITPKHTQAKNIKKCYIKLVRCDHLVKTRNKRSAENVTINTEKETDMFRENIVIDVDAQDITTDTKIDDNNDSTISIITDEDSLKPRSRSNSFSILDDFPILNDIDIHNIDLDRSSPVIEAFELIASYDKFMKPELKSPHTIPLKCDSDWFATKIILTQSESYYFHTLKNLKDISLCCVSKSLVTKTTIDKEGNHNGSHSQRKTLLPNTDIENKTTNEVPALTSLTLKYLQRISLIDYLKPLRNAHNLISGSLKRKLGLSNEVFTRKITKLNTLDETDAQTTINSSTDSDLTDMSGRSICDDSTTTLNDTPLLESAECVTATINDTSSESENIVVEDISMKKEIDITANNSNVTSSMAENKLIEEEVIPAYSDCDGTTNAINRNEVCAEANKTNEIVITEHLDFETSSNPGKMIKTTKADRIVYENVETHDDINDGSGNSNITNVEIIKTADQSIICEKIDESATTETDSMELYAPKIAQDDIYVTTVSNDSVNKDEVKAITDVICEEIIKSSDVMCVKLDSNVPKSIEISESESTPEDNIIPVLTDDIDSQEHSLADINTDSDVVDDNQLTVMKTVDDKSENVINNDQIDEESSTTQIDIKDTVLATDSYCNNSKTIKEFLASCNTDDLDAEKSAIIEEKTVENSTKVKLIREDVVENTGVLKENLTVNKNEGIELCSSSNSQNQDIIDMNKFKDQIDSYSSLDDNTSTWKMSIAKPDENTNESLPALLNDAEAIQTKYLKLTDKEGSEIILKGIEYEDPKAGMCYMFPLIDQNSAQEVNLKISDRDEIINLIRDVTDEDTRNKVEDWNCDTKLEVIPPRNTYSRIDEDIKVTPNLKRKRYMSDVRRQVKKHKGENIDYPKYTTAAMTETVYVKEYKRLFDYYSSLKFSYSRPFHKENIDVGDMVAEWPFRDSNTTFSAKHIVSDVQVKIFSEEEDASSSKDPLDQTLAQELNSDYNETEYKPSDITETNFSMGFGEGSGRVILHSNIKKISKLSAATLSDVKPHQPYLSSENNATEIDTALVEKNDEKIKLKHNMNFIKLKDQVRSFFKKTTTELTHDFLREHKKYSEEDTREFPFGLTSFDFFEQSPHNLIVNVVQVGQLPVSAAAQNPVTCDPRVTHVSNVSPSQCSAENSPGDDNQTPIKTEYTELTTADITLPLVQEYAQHHQFTSNDTQESSKTHEAENICISTEIGSEIKIEITEETSQEKLDENDSYENESLHIQTSNNVNNGSYVYSDIPNRSNVESMPDEAKMTNTFSESKDEENADKTDQLANAMNAAGITTSSDTINTTNADALVDIISQNAQSDIVTTTQMNTNNYSKSTPINAMALQQALAQILPPPLNQTSTSESGQTSGTSVAPPVLHIVQGNNSQTVLNTQNGTPLLHIVQNKSATTNNGTPASQANSFSGLSLVDTGLQQGGNQLLHIVNTGNQKNNNTGQLLKRVNLLTNIANVQGSNEQKMVQFVCKSADGKSIQLNAPHQRSMVLRLQPIDPSTIQTTPKPVESQDVANNSNSLNKDMSQQEIKSRSVYEENYAKFIQNGTGKPGQEKATSLPKFNQVFGKQVSYQENKNEMNNEGLTENTDGQQNDNVHIDQINEINNPPLLLRKSTAQTTQAPTNLIQQIKQTIAPVNIQTMHGGVIYTRQIPVNIGGGQTINLITVPSTELVDDANQKQTDNKFTNQDGDHVIKIVQSQSNNSNAQNEDNNNAAMANGNETPQQPQPQPVLTQMRIKLPMLSKTPQMVSAARVVRPSFFQIQRNVIGGANQPVYQQLVLTTAPPLGQSIRVPAQAQPARPAKPAESQSSPESQMSSSTLEQLREFDMVLEQVKERSTVQPGPSNANPFPNLHSSTDTTDNSAVVSTSVTETTQQVLYTTGNQTLNIASYVNRKSTVTSASTSFVRSPDSSGIVESPSSSTHIPHTATSESTSSETPSQPKPKKKKSKPSSSATSAMKLNTTPPKTSSQKPLEDEQTTQRILYILAEYKEQVENSPDKDKPAPRRRNNLPTNTSGSSKRKKSSSGSRRRDMSPILGEDSCRTMGSEDSSCGTSLGECAECMESHSPQESPRKVVRRLTFEQETTTTTQVTTQTRTIPQRNVIVADGQTITVARGAAGKPATTVLMPANYLLPVSMVKGGQQIAIVTNRGPKLLVGGGEGGTGGTLLFQRLIGPAGLKPVLTRPGVRHIRLPTAALHNLQAFNLAGAAAPADSTASPASASAPAPPDLVDSRAMSSPWPDRDSSDVKPERGSSPEGSEPWNLPSSSIADDYGYEEVVRTDNMDRTVLVVQRKDGRHHRLTHVSAAALRHKYAILEHEIRLQKSLSEECEDLGVDSPSASELFPEAELLFAPSPVHEQTIGPCHTPQPTILNQGIPQPDLDDQIATDRLLTPRDRQSELDINLDDVGEIVTVGEDGMGMATIPLDHEEFARSHPNTTFHTEPEDGEIPPFTIAQSIKGRQITFHASRGPSTVVMAPQTTVISQATVEASGTQHTVKFTDIDNMINSIPSTQPQIPSVLVKDDGLTRFDNILTDSRELHLSNTASAIVHSTGQGTQVIRRVRYDENRRESRYLIDEPEPMMEEKVDDNRDLESIRDDNSSPERHPELFWESNSASERSEGRRRLDFSSDSDKCCKSPFDDSTDSSFGNHTRLDSVIKAARTERSGSDGSSDDHPPLRTYPAKRPHHHPVHHEEQSLSGKTRAGERCMDVEGRRRASNRGVVKRGCHCCNGSPVPPKPKKSRQKKTADFTNSNN